jgi:hypothetical protein
MRPYAPILAVALALSVPALAPAARQTTAPNRAVLVNVNITDQGIKTAMFTSQTVNGSENYFAAYYATRGQIAYFVIRNHGKKSHNFAVLGKKTKPIRPGGKAHFHLTLARRGAFPYQSTVDNGKKGFRGIFKVA